VGLHGSERQHNQLPRPPAVISRESKTDLNRSSHALHVERGSTGTLAEQPKSLCLRICTAAMIRLDPVKHTFDEIYARVPVEQVARLKAFRLAHPYKQLTVGDMEWQYICCGHGEETLLLLPGALSVGESMFPLMTAFANDYRIIAPSYTLSLTMRGLCEGLARILEAENVNEVHVCGGSYGGLVAQYFVRQYPAQIRSLILLHTFILTRRYAKPLWLAGKLFPALPQRLFVPLLKLRLDRMLLSTLRARNHPEAEFWRAYLNEAIASDLLKQVFTHQNRCLLDLTRQPAFAPDDLKQWPGKVLIIESDDDPAIPPRERALLRNTYPQAHVHTFRDAGHASTVLRREEVVSIIRAFLNGQIQ
jgi:pimeloyl-ACP methyl ester carboxylesterase